MRAAGGVSQIALIVVVSWLRECKSTLRRTMSARSYATCAAHLRSKRSQSLLASNAKNETTSHLALQGRLPQHHALSNGPTTDVLHHQCT
eukprot:COSAG02_NODE_48634_length_332_cov_0.879828_1_plen_89_part_10